jgi:hypothetical protein
MPPVGFEPIIPAIEWPKTQVVDSTATGISISNIEGKYLNLLKPSGNFMYYQV